MTIGTPHGSLKEKQRQERERLILQAAQELLMERGFHDMSMDDVALRVGIAKGTVYLHFPSKDELLLAVLSHSMEEYIATVGAMLTGPEPPRARLEAIMRFMYASDFRQQVQLMMAIAEANPELLKRLKDHKVGQAAAVDTMRQQIAAVFDEGKASGEFIARVPTPVMVTVFESLLMPRPHRGSTQPLAVLPPDVMARHVCDIFFNGIAAGEPHTTQGMNS
jgi:TetR/AcrR family transcriptional regulator, fatty acid metabolism regulator protein